MQGILIKIRFHFGKNRFQCFFPILHREIVVGRKMLSVEPEPFREAFHKIMLAQRTTVKVTAVPKHPAHLTKSLKKIRNMVQHGIRDHRIK